MTSAYSDMTLLAPSDAKTDFPILFLLSDINRSFLQLMLIKRGGRIVYSGELGPNSSKLIEYLKVSFLFIVKCHL